MQIPSSGLSIENRIRRGTVRVEPGEAGSSTSDASPVSRAVVAAVVNSTEASRSCEAGNPVERKVTSGREQQGRVWCHLARAH